MECPSPYAQDSGAPLRITAAPDPGISNLSILAAAGREAPLVADFDVGPGSPSTLLIRAVGPSLSAFGVTNTLADPKLTLFDAKGVRVAENDDFSAAAAETFARAGAFPLRSGARDAALVTTLPLGRYTAQVDGSPVGSTLLEVFDAEGGTPQLLNLTTRTTIASGADAVITGITISPGEGTQRLLIRAIGPTLASFGEEGSAILPNPKIEVYAGTKKLAENDNWSVAPGEPYGYPFALTHAFARSGAFMLPLNSQDAALVHEFPPGSYTVVVRNQDQGRGNVMVQLFTLPSSPPPVSFPAGVLGLMDFTVTVRKVGEVYEYYPRVRVKEIGRVWSAFIGELHWTGEFGGKEERLLPWSVQRRVPLGDSVDFPETFSPFAGRPLQSPHEFSRISVRIVYTDDDLTAATIEAVARVIQ